MASYSQFGYGIRRLIDLDMQLKRAGFPVYLRVKNFTDPQSQLAQQLGFAVTPSGAVGTSDIQVVPQPAVATVSIHNIGQSNGKLRFGARTFLISDTFVEAQAAAFSVADSTTLWRQPFVVGLFSNGVLFSIEDIVNEQLTGQTITWILTCNALETQ